MLKRSFDLVVALVLMVALAPLLLVIAIMVRLAMGSPIIFVQVRAGRNDRLFELRKFRTMKELRDSRGELLPDDQRLSRFGSFLRASSMDELPELWNIIRGDMSLVGPRPLLPQYLALYNSRQRRRHEVRPGLTGWAQVNGRNALSWEERFEMDVWYVDNQSMCLDTIILLRTVLTVLSPSDVSHAGEATMPPFKGSTHQHDCESV